jgi:hypothetical protein
MPYTLSRTSSDERRAAEGDSLIEFIEGLREKAPQGHSIPPGHSILTKYSYSIKLGNNLYEDWLYDD